MKQANRWIDNLRSGGELYRLFEHIPEVMFFVKDAESRIITGNQRFLEHCGIASVEELNGKSDFEVFPKYMADKFRSDDKAIVKSGEPLLDLVELFPTRDRLPEWFVTQKYPVFSKENTVTGICGIVQSHERAYNKPDDLPIKMVRHIKSNYQSRISIPEACKSFGISQRQLERQFKRRFRISPREYIIRFRVLTATDALKQTRDSITQIALDTGFYDHSSFTRHFIKHMGMTPLKYRKM